MAGIGLKLRKISSTENTPVLAAGEPIKEAEPFVYSGCVTDHHWGTDRDIAAWISRARAAFIILKSIWASKESGTTPKISIKSVLLCESATWRMTRTAGRKYRRS